MFHQFIIFNWNTTKGYVGDAKVLCNGMYALKLTCIKQLKDIRVKLQI